MKVGISEGILLYGRRRAGLEVLLAHPAGAYWKQQDHGSWGVPKGVAGLDEAVEAVAVRESGEETGFELGSVAPNPSAQRREIGEVAAAGRGGSD